MLVLFTGLPVAVKVSQVLSDVSLESLDFLFVSTHGLMTGEVKVSIAVLTGNYRHFRFGFKPEDN